MTLDWTSRLLLACVAAVTAFAVTGVALQGLPSATPPPIVLALPTPTVDPFALATAVPTPTPTPTPTPPPTVTIAFAGDVHGEPPIENVLAEGDNPLAGVADLLGAADIAVVNLETAIGTTGVAADKTYTFQADPSLADALASAGVDVVNLANNHGLDFGHDAAEETMALVGGAGMRAVGYGADAEEAYAPALFDIGGRTVAVLGITRVLPSRGWEARADRAGMASAYDPGPAIAAVRAAREVADHVVVTIHWGRERMTCPDGEQVALARAFAAAGADAVVGHHPHVLQGVVDVDGTLVANSLGNFVFYATRAEQRRTGVLTVTLGEDGAEGYRWDPATIDSRGRPQPDEPPPPPPVPCSDPSPATAAGSRGSPPEAPAGATISPVFGALR